MMRCIFFLIACAFTVALCGCSLEGGKKIKESKDYPFPEDPSSPD